jgi:hypothetical protein
MELLKQFIKETLERGEPCPFKQPYGIARYCYLEADVCDFQGLIEFVAGILPNRTRFKGCYQDIQGCLKF